MVRKMFKLSMKNFSGYTILSILFILAGVLHYIYWGSRYGVWYDIGIYALTVFLVVPGIVGVILSLMKTEEND